MFCVVVATFFSLSSAASFLKTGMVSEAEVLTTLESELTGNVSGVRFKRLQKSLESTYRVLPKTNTGNLGHQIVRYVLHRHFVRAHGWFIRGLEPDTNEVEEWVPSYLQNLLEKAHGGSGISLHELTAFAAALEDLVHREARQRLELAYKIHEVPLHTVLEEQQVEDLITTFFVTFLKAGNFSADNAMIGRLASAESLTVSLRGWRGDKCRFLKDDTDCGGHCRELSRVQREGLQEFDTHLTGHGVPVSRSCSSLCLLQNGPPYPLGLHREGRLPLFAGRA